MSPRAVVMPRRCTSRIVVRPAVLAWLWVLVALAAGDAQIVDVQWTLPAVPRRLGEAQGGGWAAPAHIEATFEAEGVAFHLRLEPNRELLPASTSHLVQLAPGRWVQAAKPRACYYVGTVVGDPGSTAGLSTCGGGLSGLVSAHGRTIALTPLNSSAVVGAPAAAAAAAPVTSGGGSHLARRLVDEQLVEYASDVARFARSAGRNRTSARGVAATRRLQDEENQKKYIEVAVFNDLARCKGFTEGAQIESEAIDEMGQHTVEVMNSVTAMYRTQPAGGAKFPFTLHVVIVAQFSYCSGDPWDTPATGEVSPEVLLRGFHAHEQRELSSGTRVEYDNRVLLSGLDFEGNTVGLAGVSTMCNQARSGSVNMCARGQDPVGCATVVAHELGHNFGMRHDSSAIECGGDSGDAGRIMSAVGTSNNIDEFSSCSVDYVDQFFDDSYGKEVSRCLDNKPLRVEGDPVCGNGFVEEGEICDCGRGDCTGVDECCNGQTCQFASPGYQCSDTDGCCSGCMIVGGEVGHLCREAIGGCDVPEHCDGKSQHCPRNVFALLGKECTTHGFDGRCFEGQCMSQEATCAVDLHRDFKQEGEPGWDQTQQCASYVDDCQQMVCHRRGEGPSECGQEFAVHGKHMTVPDGMPCWHPRSPWRERTGLCQTGACRFAAELDMPSTANGGVHGDEECHCREGEADGCCDCSTSKLKEGASCSARSPCCDPDTCLPREIGHSCRPAADTCDLEETCDGISGGCPEDEGKPAGEPCMQEETPSTCYAKRCMLSPDNQCKAMDAERPYAKKAIEDGTKPSADLECEALSCCTSCVTWGGTYTINGVPGVPNPVVCEGCQRWHNSTTFTVNGVAKQLLLGMALDGTQIGDAFCFDGKKSRYADGCEAEMYWDKTVGRCLPCAEGCSACDWHSPDRCNTWHTPPEETKGSAGGENEVTTNAEAETTSLQSTVEETTVEDTTTEEKGFVGAVGKLAGRHAIPLMFSVLVLMALGVMLGMKLWKSGLRWSSSDIGGDEDQVELSGMMLLALQRQH